ncbi:serine hydrolase domain-containing protein [Lactobacillus sp. ESL0681]|uniref:serine hydrolase domain-containing protein n=1 Tax=Lactobacillus sp. ESL0681 TaxID=2983211 RepID=UPI0023F887A9|nr:serine hydrolase domain-containing protein [Lactobacillus sp. ESL0681]WEV41178.1 serine hydrolase [Lactobacillus sp. ESL0681]
MQEQVIATELKDSIAKQEIYGVSFSLISQQQNQYTYWGFTGKGEQHQPVSPDLYYDLASLTKVIATTTRCLQLLVNGRINLTDTLGMFLPKAAAKELTIEQLLLHRTGLVADLPNVHELTSVELQEQVLASLPQVTPGTKTEYSDLNFILLGWIIAQVDGDLLESITEHVFKPLNMAHTFYQPELHIATSLCVPTEYQEERGLVQGEAHDYKAHLLNGVSGHAGLFGTLTDLTKFTRVLSGLTPNEQVMPQAAFDLLAKYDVGARTLGWQRWSHDEQYWHTGFTGTSIAFDRQKHTGFVCLTNRIYPTRTNKGFVHTRRQLLQAFFGRKREWNQ